MVRASTCEDDIRILVADDDPVMSKFMCTVLRTGGHQPVPAFDCMQALMYAKKEPVPKAIILDLAMPAGTGLGVLENLQASFKTAHIPVLVVSGTADEATRAKALGSGASAFLAKPVAPGDLLSAVAALVA